uniref:Iron-binding zinc finger CDGSH type domain-containing protein n=1 Tax=Plectus sambesii TaxID=2011161 RepID=A0A914UJL2_9BILA
MVRQSLIRRIATTCCRADNKNGFGPNKQYRQGLHFVGTEPPALKYHKLQDKKPEQPYGLQGNNHLQPGNGKIYSKLPTKILMKKDKVYSWCSCGYSNRQPLCDGSHNRYFVPDQKLKPVRFIPDRDMEVWLCNCKQTKNRPFCDAFYRLVHMQLWVASLFYYCFCFMLCEILRWFVERFDQRHKNPTVTNLLLELVGTIQICAPMFDVGLVLDNYGLFGVFVEITLLELANVYMFRDAMAHPCPLFHAVARRRMTSLRFLLTFCVQMVGAYVSYFVALNFWKLGIHTQHLEMLEEKTCSSDLTVTIIVGCLIEGVAMFVTKAVEHYASTRYTTYENVLNCAFAGFLTVLGINFTGLYANPIVASACTFNCEGVTHLGHLGVYWLSPLVGWYAAEWYFGSDEEDEKED